MVNNDFAPATVSTNMNASQQEEEDIDPIWLSSRTARQIYGLCQVEKVSIRYHPSTFHMHIEQTEGNAFLTADG